MRVPPSTVVAAHLFGASWTVHAARARAPLPAGAAARHPPRCGELGSASPLARCSSLLDLCCPRPSRGAKLTRATSATSIGTSPRLASQTILASAQALARYEMSPPLSCLERRSVSFCQNEIRTRVSGDRSRLHHGKGRESDSRSRTASASATAARTTASFFSAISRSSSVTPPESPSTCSYTAEATGLVCKRRGREVTPQAMSRVEAACAHGRRGSDARAYRVRGLLWHDMRCHSRASPATTAAALTFASLRRMLAADSRSVGRCERA